MHPVSLAALDAAIDQPTPESRTVLFAGLACAKAAWRAKSAAALLKLYGAQRTYRGGLSRDFGNERDAILQPQLDEIRALIDEPATPAWATFLHSMVMDFDAWHDGTSYDLAALNAMSVLERAAITEWLHARLSDGNHSVDWRELEAAAALEQNELLVALKRHPDFNVRLRVKRLLDEPEDIAAEITTMLSSERTGDAVSRSLDLVSEYPDAAVKTALMRRVQRIDDHFINAAMVMLETFCGVDDAWNERPFLFSVQEEGRDGPLMQQLLDRAIR